MPQSALIVEQLGSRESNRFQNGVAAHPSAPRFDEIVHRFAVAQSFKSKIRNPKSEIRWVRLPLARNFMLK